MMIEFQADMDENGRIVIPHETRKFLGLKSKDTLNMAILGAKSTENENNENKT